MANDDPTTREQPFVYRLRDAYRPPKLSHSEQQEFDAAILARAARPASIRAVGPIAAGLLAAAVVAWLAFLPRAAPTPDVVFATSPLPSYELELAPSAEAVMNFATPSLAHLEDSLPDE